MKNLKTNTALFGSIKAKDANGLHLQDDGGNGMFIADGGDVGIGTTQVTTNFKSEIRGETYQLRLSNNANNKSIRMGVNDPEISSEGNSFVIRTLDAQPINFGTNSSNVLTIDSSGNVGIGTTNPGFNLSVVSDTDPAQIGIHGYGSFSDGSVAARLLFLGKDSNGGNRNLGHIQVKEHAHASGTGSMEFFTRAGGNENVRMTIDSSGNVGIGTTNPAKQLVVYNSTASVQQFRVESDHTGSGWGGLSAFAQKNGPLSRNIAVGAYRPETNVNPCALVQWQSRDGGVAYLWMDDSNALRLGTNSGHIGSTNGTSLGTAGTSDERLKNIEDDFEYGLSHVLQLKPIAFTFKKDAQQVRKLGFGAQTSQSVVPESVYDSGNCIDGYDAHPEHEGMNVAKSDDNELGMEYVQLIPVLTKAIQEQQQIIEDLKSQNESLVARIEALEG